MSEKKELHKTYLIEQLNKKVSVLQIELTLSKGSELKERYEALQAALFNSDREIRVLWAQVQILQDENWKLKKEIESLTTKESEAIV